MGRDVSPRRRRTAVLLAAYFEPIGGAAGDMILASLLDAGLPLEKLMSALDRLPWKGFDLCTERVVKQGVRATRLDVALPAHRHRHGPVASGLSLADIEVGIDGSSLPTAVKSRARQIFGALAWAEAGIRATTWMELRYDPIDVLDTIVDVVGAAAAFDLLGVEHVFCAPLPLGRGTVATADGPLALPFPTTVEILHRAGVPLRDSHSSEEVTASAAAILATVAEFRAPNVRVSRVGYGAGTADLDVPNVLKVSIGEYAT